MSLKHTLQWKGKKGKIGSGIIIPFHWSVGNLKYYLSIHDMPLYINKTTFLLLYSS